MKLIFVHTKWMILELIRQPTYFVATVAFPSLFYIIFAVPESNDPASSNMLLASFSCFAVFGVLFLQFGVGVAQERSTSWYHYLRTLPLKKTNLMIARFLSAYFFAILSVLSLNLLALMFTEVSMDFFIWFKFYLYLIVPGLIFCLMGLALGYFSSEKSALPLGNLIYLPLSFAGGLWKPPELLPDTLNKISTYLPTRQYGEILWNTVKDESVFSESLWILGVYLILFLIISYFGSRRDLTKKY